MDGEAGVAEPRWRWRLMEFRPPAQQNRVYDERLKMKQGVGRTGVMHWFASGEPGGVDHAANYGRGGGSRTVRVLADNVVAMVLLPRRADDGGGEEDAGFELAPDYEYDARRWQWQGGGDGDRRAGLTRHVLPPLVDVTLVVIDEASAVRLDEMAGGLANKLLPDGLFGSAKDYEQDLEALERRLLGEDGVLPMALNYRVFETTVKMRASGWSEYYDPAEHRRRGGR